MNNRKGAKTIHVGPAYKLFLLLILAHFVMDYLSLWESRVRKQACCAAPPPGQSDSIMEKRLGNNVCKDSFSADEYVNLIFLSLGTCEGASILFPLGKKHMRWNFHSGLLFVRFVLMSALAVPPWTYPEGVCLTPNLGLPFMEDHVCLSMLIPTTPKYCFHFVDGGNSGSEMLSSSSKVTFLVKCPSWDSSLRQLTQHTWSNYSSGCLSQDA